ncbi:hypothetical protein [Tumebacillus permanentifrigoris]|uniref:Uncharacterized protein n=1 Tax=Tumebacillus permanentifrigoris TaxID=378543 RepID=A0A316DDX5_9BACL|nr:hypothetical protein [Tumebacillus permanentifrigoris]PWK15722.1 hypothetical protein C7459_103274 [Tumebacillus permanentifrigoris]
MEVISRQKRDFTEEKIQEEIVKDTDPIRQLEILLMENGKRIREGGGYHYEISTLIKLFSAPQNFPVSGTTVHIGYLQSLSKVIEDIYRALQKGVFEELPHIHLLHPSKQQFSECFYDISKVFEYINNPSYIATMLEYHVNRLVDIGLLPAFAKASMDKDDLQLLLLSGLASKG